MIGNAKPSGITPTTVVVVFPELHRLPDDVATSAELLLPRAVTEHDHRGGAGLFVGVEQRPAHERRHPHQPEGRRGGLRDRHRLGSRIAKNQVPFDGAIHAKIDDRPDITLPAGEVVQQSPLVAAAGAVPHLDLDDAIAVGEWNRRAKKVARQVVPAGADPDRDGERQIPRDRQARILQEHPQAEFVVLHHVDPLGAASRPAHANERR